MQLKSIDKFIRAYYAAYLFRQRSMHILRFYLNQKQLFLIVGAVVRYTAMLPWPQKDAAV